MATLTPEARSARRLIHVDGPKLGYVSTFDGIRGIFVLQVVLFHAGVTDFLAGSSILIDLFFVLSGFLITHLLLDETNKSGDISLRRFYMRRVLRLFPAMYAMIGVFVLLMVTIELVGPPELREAISGWWLQAIGGATYTYFLIGAFFPAAMATLAPIWSLSIEECFYLLWPPTIRRTLRNATFRSDVAIIGSGLAFMVLLFFLRHHFQYILTADPGGEVSYGDTIGGLGTGAGHILGSQWAGTFSAVPEYNPSWQGVVYRLSITRPDMIVWGCLIAFVAKSIPRPVPERIQRLLAGFGFAGWACLVFTMVFTGPAKSGALALFGGPVYQFTMLMMGAVVLDAYLRQDAWYLAGFRASWARWMGERSYGIYLWHALILPLWIPVLAGTAGKTRLVAGVVASASAVCVGILSYRYIEKRFLALKDRKFANPAAAK